MAQADDHDISYNVLIPTGEDLASERNSKVFIAKQEEVQLKDQVNTDNKSESYKEKLTYNEAVKRIESCWASYRNKQMFRLLKTSICAAENSLSHEILRKIAPREATFFKDDKTVTQLKIKFRFGGSEFPPNVYFKIFLVGESCKAKYVNGRKTIVSSSEAAYDALRLMGHRNYYNQIIQDCLYHDQHKISSEADISTVKDYMHYHSVLDETPAEIGGKCNAWRRLGLDILPRQTIFYDIVAYLSQHQISERLRKLLPFLMTNPADPDVLRMQLNLISEILPAPSPAIKPSTLLTSNKSGTTTRRSKKSQQRTQRMREVYTRTEGSSTADIPDVPPGTTNVTHRGNQLVPPDGRIHQLSRADSELKTMHEDANPLEDDWEREASMLYRWTKELTLDELNLTPRI